MNKFKSFGNTSENINPVVLSTTTIDCKIICGFDYSYS